MFERISNALKVSTVGSNTSVEVSVLAPPIGAEKEVTETVARKRWRES